MPSRTREQLLTTAEVADYLNLNEKSVRRLVIAGDLPASNIGGSSNGRRLRFSPAAVERFLAERSA